MGIVALRKESVDRNIFGCHTGGTGNNVALRKESVDRNTAFLAARVSSLVALRKESVDRNRGVLLSVRSARSLSARRAWIEIVPFRGHDFWPRVALRKESVDRNRGGDTHANRYYGRSPQGERG